MTISPYKILEIPEGSNEDTIKQAYRQQAMKWHPDKNPQQKELAEQKFKDINQAYEYLTKINTQSFDLDDIFNTFFTKMKNPFRDHQNKLEKSIGKSIIQEINVTLEELYNGTTKNVEYKHYIIDPNKPNEMCNRCQGRGEIITIQKINELMMTQQIDTCIECNGQGYSGTLIENISNININIPSGTPDDEMLILQGKGSHLIGGIPGDLMIHVNTIKHKLFKRDENNLHITLNISFKKAMLGFKYNLLHLSGKKYNIKIKGPININTPIIIKGKGMHNGDLHIKITFSLPKSLTNEQIDIINKNF